MTAPVRVTNCTVCQTRLDPFWATMGVTIHPTCDMPCVHDEPRGPRYCALCRKARQSAVPVPTAPVERDVAPVGLDHPLTSLRAAQRALPGTGTKRRMVLDALIESGGLCDWEIEARFRWKHESASACRRSLVTDGWVIDSGRTRPVPDTGNDAIVWIPAPTPAEPAPETPPQPDTGLF